MVLYGTVRNIPGFSYLLAVLVITSSLHNGVLSLNFVNLIKKKFQNLMKMNFYKKLETW